MADEQKKNETPVPAEPTQAELDQVNVRLGEDDDDGVPPEMRRLVDWLKANATLVGAAVVAALIGFIASNFIKGSKVRKEEQVTALISAAEKPEDIEGILNTYGDTAAAANARLGLARARAREAAFDQALAQYDQFLSRQAAHPFRVNAELERLQVLEALGKNDEALTGVVAFLEKHPTHYLRPDAILTRARILRNLGKNAEAKVVLDDLLASDAADTWKSIAREKLSAVERALKQPAAK